jgi:hypothetical protein
MRMRRRPTSAAVSLCNSAIGTEQGHTGVTLRGARETYSSSVG